MDTIETESPPLLSVLELVLHFHSFKNVDLYRQGLYCLRSSFFVEDVNMNGIKERDTALPYHILTSSKTSPEFGKPNLPNSPYASISSSSIETEIALSKIDQCVYPAHIDDVAQTFQSRTFRIQYSEQEMILNDACLFRLEVNARFHLPIFLEVSLLHADYTQTDVLNGLSPPSISEFSAVSTKLYMLTTAFSGGVHSFVPIVFDEHHYCLTKSMIHSHMLEFRFRLPKTISARMNGSSSSVSSTSRFHKSISSSELDMAAQFHSKHSTSSSTHLSPPPLSSEDLDNSPTLNVLSRTPPKDENAPHVLYYPPVAHILFPRLSDPNVLPHQLPYTESEVKLLSDRYHHYFMNNLIRAYNELGCIFEWYTYHLKNDTKRNVNATALIKPLDMPPGCILDDSENSRNRKSQSNSSLTRPRSVSEGDADNIVNCFVNDGSRENDHISGSADDIDTIDFLPLPFPLRFQSSNTPPSPSALSPTLSTKLSSSQRSSRRLSDSSIPQLPGSLRQLEPQGSAEIDQLTQRYQKRRRRSYDNRTVEDFNRERIERLELKRLKEKFRIPRLVRLSARMGSNLSCSAAAKTILRDSQYISQQSFQLWNTFIQFLPVLCNVLFTYSSVQYEQQFLEYSSNFVFRESYAMEDRFRLPAEDMVDVHNQVASFVRQKATLLARSVGIQIQELEGDTTILSDPDQIILFEDAYRHDNTILNSGASFHFSHSMLPKANKIQPVSTSSTSTTDATEEKQEPQKEALSFQSKIVTEVTEAIDNVIQNGLSDHNKSASPPNESLPGSPAESPEQPPSNPAQDRLEDQFRNANEAMMNDRSGTFRLPGSPHLAPTDHLPIGLQSPRMSRKNSVPTEYLHSKSTSTEGRHVIFFVHGYQGNSFDMRMWKNQFSLIAADALLIVSNSNVNQTEGDIQQMGERLAQEIVDTIEENCKDCLGRISFVAHSLGGIIVRSALTTSLMQSYLPYLYSFISLAVPHCGLLYSENMLITTGLWLLKKWNKSLCLSQLSMTDSLEPTSCFLYQLAQQPVLAWFENVLLFASQQDKYIPFSSARIEMSREADSHAERGDRKGLLHVSMTKALLSSLRCRSLKRFDVNFRVKKKNLDSFIGRMAHIYFLDQAKYLQMVVTLYKHYII